MLDRFMRRVSPPDANGCRNWRLAKGQVYGQFNTPDGKIGPHVASARCV